ncbi:hypothetical protein PG994_004441 [Apiospora phragmitis]|uniref:Uncharacterized protein n=1 Tax=Apiospora phragmitis TaxID=2905665 RepID=A0ABR1VQU8_9PEZI
MVCVEDGFEFLSDDSDRLNYARSCDLFIAFQQSSVSLPTETMIEYLASILPPDIAKALQSPPDGTDPPVYPSWASWSALLTWYHLLAAQKFNDTNHLLRLNWYEYTFWRVAEADATCMQRACPVLSAGNIEVDPDMAGIGSQDAPLLPRQQPSVVLFLPPALGAVLPRGRDDHVRIRYWLFHAATFVCYCMWMMVIWLTATKNAELSFIFVLIQTVPKGKSVLGELVNELDHILQPYCDYQFNASTRYLKMAVACVWVVMLTPPGMYLIIGTVHLIECLLGSTTDAASRLTSRFFHFVLPLFCLVGMWTILGLILNIRGVLTAASRDELSKIEINEWGVGQILATLTWIPVVVEMGRIAIGK